VDWFANLKVGLNLNFFILYTFPIPSFTGTGRQIRIARLAAGLATATDGDFGDWASLAEPILNEAQREAAMVEIDGLVAQEFALTIPELKVVFDQGNPLRSSFREVLPYVEEQSE
jgi:hypothetical protein